MAYRQRTTKHWLRRLVAGFGALVSTVAVVGGAPLLLAQVAGNPLPHHVPTAGEIGDLLTSPDNGELFLRLLGLIGWIAWATFAVSVLVEIPAQLRGRRAIRLPGLGLQQRIASVLVGAVIAVFAGATVSAAAPAAPPPAVVQTITVAAPNNPIAVPMQGGPVDLSPHAALFASAQVGVHYIKAAQMPVIQRPVYVVRKNDYLGKIAQRFCGDFDRYRQIAALNPELVRNPNRIQPGWRLVLPTDAHDTGVIRHASGKLIVPAATQPGPEQPPVVTPPVVTPPVIKPPVVASPAATTPAAKPPAAPVTRQHTPPQDGAGINGVHTLAAGAGVAAVGVLAAHVILKRRRTRRINQLRVKRRRNSAATVRGVVPLFAPTSAQSAKHRAADRLDSGLRRLTVGLNGRAAWEMPDIAAAWQHGGDIAVILATPCGDPPTPFETRSPNTWSLPSTARVTDSSSAPSLLPGLVTVGTWAQGGELFVDGERTGLLSLVGNPQSCDDLLRFLAAEAATASWSDDTSVVVAGFNTADLGALAELNPRRVRVAVSIDDAIVRISRRASANSALLREAQTNDTISARVNNITEAAWSTHLLFIADAWGEHAKQLQNLDAQLAALGRVGVVVVATQPAATRWSAHVSADGSLEMAWLAVTGTTACQLTSDQLIEQAEAIRYARDAEPSEVGPRHRLRV